MRPGGLVKLSSTYSEPAGIWSYTSTFAASVVGLLRLMVNSISSPRAAVDLSAVLSMTTGGRLVPGR